MHITLPLILALQAVSPGPGASRYYSTTDGRQMLVAATFDEMIDQDAAACDALGLARVELEMIDDGVADSASTISAASHGAAREGDVQDGAERLHHLTEGMAKASGRLLYVETLLCPSITKIDRPAS